MFNPIIDKIADLEKKRNDLKGDKKDADLAEAVKDEIKKIDADLDDQKSEKKKIYEEFSKSEKQVKQIVDLTLLSNNLLKGQALSEFIKRSFELM